MSMIGIVACCVVLLIVLLVCGVTLPYCFGAALMFMAFTGGILMKSMIVWDYTQIISSTLLASPLFILAGSYMGGSGIATKLLDFVDSFVGRIRGGLGVVSVVSCAIIGAISGSGFTGVAATGPVIIPRMESQGYPRGYATSLVTVSSVLGLLIPPSGIMILYGWQTGTSVLACFLATVGPGVLIAFLFCVINMIWSRKFDLKLDAPMPVTARARLAVRRFVIALPALLMPIIILGGIYGGVFTPTEAAAVAALYAIPIGIFVYRTMKLKDFYEMTMNSLGSIGAIMAMIIFCLMLSQTFVTLRVPEKIIEVMTGITDSRVLMLIILNLFLFLVGMIVNDATGMLLCSPILLPLALELGIDAVQFSAIMGVNLAMGGITPPYASILYLGMRVGNCPFNEMIKPALIFLLFGYVPVVFLTTFWAPLSTWLPAVMGLM